jgi:DNA-binding winged helix-turn-helix (wHTH) protein
MNQNSGKRFRFGAFEADLPAGELRKNGKVIRLQVQPFQVLVALLERPGEVVTRDELRARLWPEESFGDFDQGLNTAINKLREALGDSAVNPRFVETLPKRGYRFTFPWSKRPRRGGAILRWPQRREKSGSTRGSPHLLRSWLRSWAWRWFAANQKGLNRHSAGSPSACPCR